MFDLPGDGFPEDAASLQQRLEAAVRRRVAVVEDRKVVTAEVDGWPQGRLLRVDLTGGQVVLPEELHTLQGELPPEWRPPTIDQQVGEGPRFEVFEVVGEPLRVGPIETTLRLNGRDVAFAYGRSRSGEPVMAPTQGRGDLHVSAPREQAVRFVAEQARTAAAEKGVALDRVDADVRVLGPREVAIDGRLTGSKKLLMMTARFEVRFAGELEVDDEMTGRFRRLEVQGQGMVMEALLALLRPKIEQIRDRPLPLRDLMAGVVPSGLRLRDLRLSDEAGRLQLTASFGDESGAA